MREDFDKFNLKQDLQELKADLDRLSADVGHIMWKSTVGRVEHKIAKRPFYCMLLAFGAGLACCRFFKIFRSKK